VTAPHSTSDVNPVTGEIFFILVPLGQACVGDPPLQLDVRRSTGHQEDALFDRPIAEDIAPAGECLALVHAPRCVGRGHARFTYSLPTFPLSAGAVHRGRNGIPAEVGCGTLGRLSAAIRCATSFGRFPCAAVLRTVVWVEATLLEPNGPAWSCFACRAFDRFAFRARSRTKEYMLLGEDWTWQFSASTLAISL
jgi:hypothetical protein